MVDMAHFAGLVAGGVFEGNYNPVPFAHVVTTTTHKTLRGPRGGMILCTSEFTEAVDKGCPIVLGGPLPHALAAKAVALREASQPSFRDYARRIVQNSQALAEAFMSLGMDVVTGGTDNHLLLLDVHKSFGLTGRQAESAIRECHLTLNRNAVPFDANGPWYTSGLRVGTPAVTTLGMAPNDMKEIASVFKLVLSDTRPSIMQKGPEAGQPSRARYSIGKASAQAARERVAALLDRYPVYPEIDLDMLLAAARGWEGADRPTAAVAR
jgi:glycine hydroxymethyltransferase